MNYIEREIANKKKWTDAFGAITDLSGIYILRRVDEDGIKYAYVGQAKHILTRLADHLKASSGIITKDTQHIDFSLKKHGLYSTDNRTGWLLSVLSFPIEELDERERHYIKYCAKNGYQLRNKTAGGQDKGKHGIAPNKPAKGYYDGVAQGEKNAKKIVATFFEKYLDANIKGQPNKIKERKLNEFLEYIRSYAVNEQ